MMGPLWSGQGTVPHCTVSDLLSTDVLVSSSGALVGTGGVIAYILIIYLQYKTMYIPADVVLVEEVTVLLLLLPNTAVTLTVQLLPALREVMVWVVAVPLTVSDDDRYSSE